MATIKTVTKFKFKGVEYNNLSEIKDKIHNTIGEELFDKMQRICPLEKHKDYFVLLDLICSPPIRKMLLECLDVDFEIEGERFNDGEVINILDYDKKKHNI